MAPSASAVHLGVPRVGRPAGCVRQRLEGARQVKEQTEDDTPYNQTEWVRRPQIKDLRLPLVPEVIVVTVDVTTLASGYGASKDMCAARRCASTASARDRRNHLKPSSYQHHCNRRRYIVPDHHARRLVRHPLIREASWIGRSRATSRDRSDHTQLHVQAWVGSRDRARYFEGREVRANREAIFAADQTLAEVEDDPRIDESFAWRCR